MKKTMRIVALLLALVMMTAVLAGCNNGDDNTTTDPSTTAAPGKTYTWNVTLSLQHYNFDAGENVSDFVLTEKANAANTLTLSPAGLLGEYVDTGDVNKDGNPIMAWTKVEDLNTVKDEFGGLVLTGELKSSSADFKEADWNVVNNKATLSYEVVTAPTDTTNGELAITAIAPDYTWNITFVYEAGACGTYEFVNPGLPGDWDVNYGEQYVNQTFNVTPDNTSFTMNIFNHENWIVDNSKEWYKWVEIDNDDECPYYTYEVVKAMNISDRTTPGELTVHISLEAPAA